MNELACNYDSEASYSDGHASCSSSFDCNGDCINDADNDGVCDEFEIAGCTNPNACNFDASATDDDDPVSTRTSVDL